MMKWRCNIGGFGRTKRKIKEDGIGRETNHKRLNLTKQTEGCWGEVCWERMVGVWTLGRAGAMVSDGECCEMCKPGDSQTCTPRDKNTLYVYKKF